MTLRLFKLACLSYRSSEVQYRDQQFSREALLQLRRTIIEKCTQTLPESTLFSNGPMYPRRYFDDLVMEQR